MTWLSDGALERLRHAAEAPDLNGTHYRIIGPVGRGGMGVVYLAEDQALGRRVAVKVLELPDEAGDLAARLLREARILAHLEHPGIVPVHDAGTLPDGRVYYAMKYVEGSRLDEYARTLESAPDRLRVFQKICDAVAFAHSRGVLHRDLKPENVMVGPFGEVLVMDWGVAKILPERSADAVCTDSVQASSGPSHGPSPEARQKTATGTVVGTPGYMSPEQARGEASSLDQRTDVYALGMILRFLLDLPANASAHPVASGGVAAPLAAIVAKATQADPAGRYVSAADLAADVARYLNGLPLEAYPDTFLRRTGRFLERHQVVVLLVLAYLLTRALLILLTGH
jgi:serine/threonine protein kinase